jgi:hypothetical protein
MSIVIEQGIPFIHRRGRPRGQGSIQRVLKQMNITDSAVVPVSQYPGVTKAAQSLGMKVRSSKISETDVRFWRLA